MTIMKITMTVLVVNLRLMLSYHNVQLGQWELVARQNFIIGVSNIVSLYSKHCRNIEHVFQLNQRTIKSFQEWCLSSRSTWRTGRCTAMSLQHSGNLPEKNTWKSLTWFLPGMEGKTLMYWVSPSGRTSTLPPVRYWLTHQNHLTSASKIFPPLESDQTNKRPLTRLQERLIKKLGGKCKTCIPPSCLKCVLCQSKVSLC